MSIMMMAQDRAMGNIRALFELEPELLDSVAGGCDGDCLCPDPGVTSHCDDNGCTTQVDCR